MHLGNLMEVQQQILGSNGREDYTSELCQPRKLYAAGAPFCGLCVEV